MSEQRETLGAERRGASERARRASSFARVAHEYERGRPGYPPEAIDRLWRDDPQLAGREHALLPWRARVRRCAGLLNRA